MRVRLTLPGLTLPRSTTALAAAAVLIGAAGSGQVAPGVSASTAWGGRSVIPPVASSIVAPSPTEDQAPGTAQVWSTTPDRASLMRAVGTFGAGQPLSVGSGAAVTLDQTVTAQSVAGFGAALTHSSASLLAALPAAERTRVLRALFDPEGPTRLSVVRIPLGSSDFTTGAHFTYDDVARGGTDWGLRRFSTARDDRSLRPVLREIRAINPGVVLMASPWSAPAWLKDSRSLFGGRLGADPRTVPTYATYLARALREYRDAGIPIDILTLQNEPQTRWPADYPRMEMPVAQQVALAQALALAMRSAGVSAQVLAFDHNWAQHPADAAAVPTGADPEDDYPLRVLGSAAGGLFQGVAFHCYHGAAAAQEVVHEAFPSAGIWMTECSGTRSGEGGSTTFPDTLYWHSRNLLIPSLRHWAAGVLTWNLALDPSGGPHRGGCSTCTPVVTLAADGTTTYEADRYVLAHAARFLPRGSVRIGSAVDDAQFEQVAFRTPDGSLVVLLHHAGWTSRSVTLWAAGQSYQVPVAPWSLTTVRIRPAVA